MAGGTGRAAQDTGRERGRWHKRVLKSWGMAGPGSMWGGEEQARWDARKWGRMLGNGIEY